MTSFTDPVELFYAALSAVNAEDWLGAAQLCDAASLRAYHRQMLERFAPTEPPFELTTEFMLKHQPKMPLAVAEYYVAEQKKNADPSKHLQNDLPGITSVEMLRSVQPAAVFAAWLLGRSTRRQVERLVAAGHLPKSALSSGYHPALRHPYIALGAVADGDDVMQVIYRSQLMTSSMWAPDIGRRMALLNDDDLAFLNETVKRAHVRHALCRRQVDGSWCLVADNDFLGISSSQMAGFVEAGASGNAPDIQEQEEHDVS